MAPTAPFWPNVALEPSVVAGCEPCALVRPCGGRVHPVGASSPPASMQFTVGSLVMQTFYCQKAGRAKGFRQLDSSSALRERLCMHSTRLGREQGLLTSNPSGTPGWGAAVVALALATGCSQSGQSNTENTGSLTPAPPPNTSVPVPATSDVGGQQPVGVAPSPPPVSPGTGDTPTGENPSPDVPPVTSPSGGPDGPGPEPQPTNTAPSPTECEPEPPPPAQTCTDNINEDEPDLPCSQWVEWGTCDESWMIERNVCDRSCGRCTGDEIVPAPAPVNTCQPTASDAGAPQTPQSAPPVMTNGPKLPPIEGGQPGFTTRYWDCCKPHCGWPGNSGNPISSCDSNNNNMGGDFNAGSACTGGPAHMCWNFVPQTNGDNIAFAYAAHNGVGCGTCFQLDFTGESKNPKEDGHDFGSQSLKGKSMIVQVINTGGIEPGQFDLLVPGGGVGEFNACSDQWGGADLGEQYGGFFLACQKEHDFEYEPARQCARDWCDRVFSDKPELHAGCSWFVEWFALADNPTMQYKEVPCPSELSSVSGL